MQVGEDDKIGVQLVPLKELTPHEPKKFTLDLLKNTNMNDPHNRKPRGTLEVELTFDPFKLESDSFKGLGTFSQKQVSMDRTLADDLLSEAGLLSVTVIGAEDLEAVKYHTNPYAQILFRGERRKTTVKFLAIGLIVDPFVPNCMRWIQIGIVKRELGTLQLASSSLNLEYC